MNKPKLQHITHANQVKQLAKPMVGRGTYEPGAYNKPGKKGESMSFIPKK